MSQKLIEDFARVLAEELNREAGGTATGGVLHTALRRVSESVARAGRAMAGLAPLLDVVRPDRFLTEMAEILERASERVPDGATAAQRAEIEAELDAAGPTRPGAIRWSEHPARMYRVVTGRPPEPPVKEPKLGRPDEHPLVTEAAAMLEETLGAASEATRTLGEVCRRLRAHGALTGWGHKPAAILGAIDRLADLASEGRDLLADVDRMRTERDDARATVTFQRDTFAERSAEYERRLAAAAERERDLRAAYDQDGSKIIRLERQLKERDANITRLEGVWRGMAAEREQVLAKLSAAVFRTSRAPADPQRAILAGIDILIGNARSSDERAERATATLAAIGTGIATRGIPVDPENAGSVVSAVQVLSDRAARIEGEITRTWDVIESLRPQRDDLTGERERFDAGIGTRADGVDRAVRWLVGELRQAEGRAVTSAGAAARNEHDLAQADLRALHARLVQHGAAMPEGDMLAAVMAGVDSLGERAARTLPGSARAGDGKAAWWRTEVCKVLGRDPAGTLPTDQELAADLARSVGRMHEPTELPPTPVSVANLRRLRSDLVSALGWDGEFSDVEVVWAVRQKKRALDDVRGQLGDAHARLAAWERAGSPYTVTSPARLTAALELGKETETMLRGEIEALKHRPLTDEERERAIRAPALPMPLTAGQAVELARMAAFAVTPRPGYVVAAGQPAMFEPHPWVTAAIEVASAWQVVGDFEELLRMAARLVPTARPVVGPAGPELVTTAVQHAPHCHATFPTSDRPDGGCVCGAWQEAEVRRSVTRTTAARPAQRADHGGGMAGHDADTDEPDASASEPSEGG